MEYRTNEMIGKPIFILSCTRSGSTLLRCVIDTHSQLCSPGHLNLGLLCSNLYLAAYYSIGQLPEIETEEQRERIAVEEVQRVVNGLLGRYVEGKGKRNWCEKSTVNIDYLNVLHKIFPEAKYVCLYRNCLDVSYSCIKFSPLGYMDELAPYVQKRPTNFVAAMIENWLDKNKKLLEFEETHTDQCIRVNYESVVQQPERVLAELFGFLGESWDEGLIDAVFRTPHDQGNGDVKVWFSDKINKDSIGNGTAIPLAAIPMDLMVEVDVLHQKLGYPRIEMLYSQQHNDAKQQFQEFDVNEFVSRRVSQQMGKDNDKSNALRGRCKFEVTGFKGGVWLIESNSNEIAVVERGIEVECTISITYKVFCEVMAGCKSAVQAYEQGEIVGYGNVVLALEFGRMLFGGS